MIFWDVDTQVDFLDPQGKLYVPGSERIVPKLEALTRCAGDQNILVIASACAHHEDDPEFQQFPPHCLAGTPGQRKIPQTLLPNRLVLPSEAAEVPRAPRKFQQIILEKRQFNVFSSPNSDSLLERLIETEITLYGVVTEICVAATVRGLLDRGYRVRIVTDAVRALEEPKAQSLFEEVQQRGGRLVTTTEIVRPEAA